MTLLREQFRLLKSELLIALKHPEQSKQSTNELQVECESENEVNNQLYKTNN